MKGSGDTYVYDMIEELVPTRRNIDKYLFNWDDLPGTSESRRKLFDKLDKIYDLKWLGSRKTYESHQSGLLQYELLKFEKSDGNKYMTISHGSDQIGIELSETESDTAHMLIHTKGRRLSQSLSTQRKSGKLRVYLSNYTPIPIRYLDIKINEKGQRLISDLKDRMHVTEPNIKEIELNTSNEVLKIQKCRKYWQYSLNIRGFILYLLGSIPLDRIKQGAINRQVEWKKKGPKPYISYDKRRIEKILEALSNNWSKNFPFLLYYPDLKKVLPRHFIADLYQQIAEELQYQLDTSDVDFLKYWVIRRCYDAITNHFGALEQISSYSFIKNIDLDTLKKLKDYRVKMLNYMIKYLSGEEQHRRKALEGYEAGF